MLFRHNFERLSLGYALLDGAAAGNNLPACNEFAQAHASLYRDSGDESLIAAGPHLLRLKNDERSVSNFFSFVWGKSLGVYINADTGMEDLWKHFRRFLIVRTESGQRLYFRFYDPRIMAVFLPTCSPGQLRDLFGPVNFLLIENGVRDSGSLLSLMNGKLHVETLDLSREIPELSLPVKKTSSAEAHKHTIV